MKLVIGLGNPGPEYRDTRHNIGYRVLEELACRHPVQKQDSKYDAIIGEIRIKGEKVLLVKPLTYMNLSGRSVQPLVHWHKLDLADMIVIYDDMDLPVGMLRIRPGGGSGGHKGVQSIMSRLNTGEFPRIRVGIGRPAGCAPADWVLGRFSGADKEFMESAVRVAADAVETWVASGLTRIMNEYN